MPFPHPHYRFRYADPTFCASCGGDTLPVEQTHLGLICSDCRTRCAYCEDWMMGAGVTVDGKRMHSECAEELNALADKVANELMKEVA